MHARRGLDSATLKLIFEDDRSVKEGAIPAFEKVINTDKVSAILGPTPSNSAPAADPIAQDKQVVVRLTSNTAGGILEIATVLLPEGAAECDARLSARSQRQWAASGDVTSLKVGRSEVTTSSTTGRSERIARSSAPPSASGCSTRTPSQPIARAIAA